MISSAINPFAAPWSHVANLYRRICLLRARGRGAEAEQIQQGEFAEARAAAERATHVDDPSLLQSLIQAFLDAEEARVTEAMLLAETLAPLVADLIRPALASSTGSMRTEATTFASGPHTTARAELPRSPPAVAPSIADLIDGMLVQERPRPDPRSQKIPA